MCAEGRNDEKRKEPILLDYYAGVYGPTIRIGVGTPEGLLAVRSVIPELAQGWKRAADESRPLRQHNPAKSNPLTSMVLRDSMCSGEAVVKLYVKESRGSSQWHLEKHPSMAGPT